MKDFNNRKFDLGDIVKDTITGFEGVVTGVQFWYNGCIRYSVQAKALKDGKPLDLEYFDEPQLALVERVALGEVTSTVEVGGPMPTPKRWPS